MNGKPQWLLRTGQLIPSSSSLQAPRSSHRTSGSNVSSTYSQPSPDLRNDVPRLTIPRSSSIYPEDVSPPDTPRSFDERHSGESSPNVSPILDAKPISRAIPPLRKITPSRIPEPRPTHPPLVSKMDASIGRDGPAQPHSADKTPKKETRWDAFSGEPTHSQLGKPAQVVPGNRAFSLSPVNSDSDGPMGNSVHVTGGTQPKSYLVDRLRKVPKRDPNQPPPEREPWKGASGRSAIIRALVDKPLPPGKEPIFQPNPAAPRNPEGPRAANMSKQPPPYKSIVTTQSLPKSPPPRGASRIPPPDLTIRPVVPLKAGRNSPLSPATRAASKQPEILHPGHNDTRSPLARNPSADIDANLSTPRNTPADMTPIQSPEDTKQDETEDGLGANFADLKIQDEPSSRFSATTYNTTMQESPPRTPRIRADTPPALPTPPSPVLSRKRPIPTSGVSTPKGTTRKPTPFEASNSGAKSLPVSPPAEVVDRVASLSAKVEALTRRRAELQTMIHELTQVVQPSSIKYDMASRQEIKKTVARLETETATVTKDIHETGMKLHRAQKRRDEESLYEPTGLWVRRVTE